MMELVDTSVFVGHWAFRAHRFRAAAELKEHLQASGVTQAWACSAEAILFADPMQGNEPLFKEVAGDPFFVPTALLDLSLAAWKDDATACLEKWGCGLFKLIPSYHEYDIEDYCVDDLIQFATARDVPIAIQLRMSDDRTQHPRCVVPALALRPLKVLAARYPEARFLVCGLTGEGTGIAKAPNLWVELSLIESEEALVKLLENCREDRVVFGSHSPLQYLGSMLAKLHVAEQDVDPRIVDAILAANARTLLGAGAGDGSGN